MQPVGNAGEASTSNFATIKTTSIVSKQQKEHLQEDMHAAMSGYKRMRQEHQRAQAKVGASLLFAVQYLVVMIIIYLK